MRDKPLVDWAWVADHLDEIVARSLQHVGLALLAVAAGFAISLVVGVAVARRRRASAFVIGFSGVLYTIPSIAAFAALVPVTGLSLLTALIPADGVHAADPAAKHRRGAHHDLGRHPRDGHRDGLHGPRPPPAHRAAARDAADHRGSARRVGLDRSGWSRSPRSSATTSVVSACSSTRACATSFPPRSTPAR